MNILKTILQIFLLTYIVNMGTILHAESIKISDVFVPDMIGADLEYLEHRTGPAKNTMYYRKEAEKIYKIDSCYLTARIHKGSVVYLKVNLNSKCTFELNKFIEDAPPAHLLTFGKFDALTNNRGVFMSDCLKSCGNMADPVIYENLYGAKINGWIDIMVEATQTGNALKAANKWEKHMEKAEGHDWVVYDRKFNCKRTKYDSYAHKVFKKVKIDAITIGYELGKKWCKSHMEPAAY